MITPKSNIARRQLPWSRKLTSICYATTEVKTEDDLLPPGAKPGTIPTDLEQSTGLERLELLGKMQGIDIFDMRPLDASRKGTISHISRKMPMVYWTNRC
jgi:cytochrome c oxidase subunit 5b